MTSKLVNGENFLETIEEKTFENFEENEFMP